MFFCFSLFSFFVFFYANDIFWTITEWNNKKKFIGRKFKEKKKVDTKEFLRNQQETKISEGYNLINGAKLRYQMMETSWSRGHAKTQIPEKPSKSGLIGVWHKDNLYLGTSTIENRDPHPTNIDLQTRNIKVTPWRQLFFDKSFSVL